MKNILIGIGAVVLICGVSFALVSRNVLKMYFQTGDKPTQEQFSNTIDSNVNLQDDKAVPTASKEHNPTKAYVAGDTVVKTEPILQAKILTQAQKEFKLDAVQSVTFRWTPVTPRPEEPVTYRLKVWQLMQGQNGTQAMRSNAPIVTKDVTNMSEATVSGIYTGPCKPPYLCDYVWSVESISTASTNTSTNAGTNTGTVESIPSETSAPATTETVPPAQTEGTSGASDGTH